MSFIIGLIDLMLVNRFDYRVNTFDVARFIPGVSDRPSEGPK